MKLLEAAEILDQSVSVWTMGVFQRMVYRLKGSVTAGRLGAIEPAWEQWKLPGSTKELVAASADRADVSCLGDPVSSGEGSLSGYFVS